MSVRGSTSHRVVSSLMTPHCWIDCVIFQHVRVRGTVHPVLRHANDVNAVLKMTHNLISEDEYLFMWEPQRVGTLHEEGSSFVAWKATDMYQNIHARVCVRVHSHTRFFPPPQVCLHTFTHTQRQFKHTHSRHWRVCVFTFSILGCYCFVAVLGAAAHRVEAEEEEEEEGEVLDRHRCLLALAALRHAKWFQVGTHSLPVFLPDAYCSLTTRSDCTCPQSAIAPF